MEKEGVQGVNLDEYSGVIIGGGPFDVSKPIKEQKQDQKRAEKELIPLIDQIVKKDFPYYGNCYGLGFLVKYQGGEVSKENFIEDVGAITVTLTEAGKKDPLLEGLPDQFRAFVGHKESCQSLPKGAVLLAKGEVCPIQLIKMKNNIYASQFHPELDVKSLILRLNIYKDAGYFDPAESEALFTRIRKEKVTVPLIILKRFVDRYRSD